MEILIKIGIAIVFYITLVTAIATGVSVGLKNYFEKEGRK